MLISDRYKFIFFHVPKTAGTAVTVALEPFVNKQMSTVFKRGDFYKQTRLRTHMPWEDFPDELRSKYETYFRFCFVRNPYERIVSYFEYVSRHPEHSLHRKFGKQRNTIYEKLQIHMPRPQYRFTNGMNFVGKYEKLEEHFHKVCKMIGIKPVELIRIKNSYIKNYQDYICDKAKFLIDQFYHKDFIELGYAKNFN